ncbi:hypothetical protein EYC80_005441 [Monilinia laxa]|uniref:Glycoside hydrolase family 3 N-terminal domain-containing protein n=1 Tax=Monilinia laxa TaxID=61186 RepID=A0A5N6KE63_MONLA|nr:hypothetical protein EYC80_005441 [Monilinia laxa]
MDVTEEELDPVWKDLDWAMGQCFMVGFEGTEVTPQIRTLIEDHHLGAILLSTKNLKTARQTANLVQELQTIAHEAGHPVPLIIALDQENGGVNSLFDEDYICQFPSAMGVAATGSLELAYEVANATAKELSAVGVNMIMGPCLDVLTNARYQPLGVRATGDDPQEVSQYGIAAMNGYKDAGIATCGKHFPSYGNLDFLGSSLDMPIITETLEQLSLGALVPFRNAIREGMDSIMVGGCAIANAGMNVMHACLSDQVVDDLLRNDLGFNGVVVSECLEMEALSHDIGVRGGTVMAVEAGCDLVLLCRSYAVQREAIAGLKLGLENDMISRDRINLSLKRALKVKSQCTSWAKALNPLGINHLASLHPSHLALSTKAYDHSITVMRDKGHLLPLSNSYSEDDDDLLLLTPLVKPLPASAATASLNSENTKFINTEAEKSHKSSIMSGEGVFRELGRALARQRHGRLLHTSYTANGVRPVHENLINRAGTIIIITADATRNLYQNGFTKHVAMMCSILSSAGKKKSLIVVSVSSPYDFAMDKSIGTYVCTFDFTETAMKALVRALFGDFVPQGTLPGTLRKSRKVQKPRQHWLVESYNKDRDTRGLQELIKSIEKTTPPNQQPALGGAIADSFELPPPVNYTPLEESHYVVLNSSTQALFGFCSTTYSPNTHTGTISSTLPAIYLGIPMSDLTEGARLKRWFATNGWDVVSPRLLYTLIIRNVAFWTPPEGLFATIQRVSLQFDLIHGPSYSATQVLDFVQTHSSSAEILSIYNLAIADPKSCGIVRAKSPIDGSLVGTVIISRSDTLLSRWMPVLSSSSSSYSHSQNTNASNSKGKEKEDGNRNGLGGIIAPVIPANNAQRETILQGLVMLSIRQNKNKGDGKGVVLNWVVGGDRDVLLGMGFDVLEAWEEVVCGVERWSKMNLG